MSLDSEPSRTLRRPVKGIVPAFQRYTHPTSPHVIVPLSQNQLRFKIEFEQEVLMWRSYGFWRFSLIYWFISQQMGKNSIASFEGKRVYSLNLRLISVHFVGPFRCHLDTWKGCSVLVRHSHRPATSGDKPVDQKGLAQILLPLFQIISQTRSFSYSHHCLEGKVRRWSVVLT